MKGRVSIFGGGIGMYQFDKIIDRSNTSSVKWDPEILLENFGVEDCLPLWVADMDFEVAPAIKEALIKVADHGVYGYSGTKKHMDAFVNWVDRRFDWLIQSEWLLNTPGVVNAFNVAIQTYTRPGDQVIIQRPVYYPFTDAIVNNGRRVSSNSLILNEEGRYDIDFEDFEMRAKDPNTTMFLLCSPHNPVGRLWTKEELTKMMQICLDNNVLVVSDEIHADLVMPGYVHYPAGTIHERYLENLITLMAPSKTFNLAGMQLSYVVISDEIKRREFARTLEQGSIGIVNRFAFESATVAYNDSEDWLDAVIDYIHGNYKYVKEYFKRELPAIGIHELEATYLVWMDFRSLDLTLDELTEVIFKDAKVGLDGGDWFGSEGAGFMRMNLACPREIIEKACEAIVAGVKKIKQ